MKYSKPETDKGGTKRWKNAKGQYHCEDGPAIEYADGSRHYYIDGKRHREDGPAMEWTDGSKFYYIGGQRHREDGPAAEYADGGKLYYINNKLHREDGPAIEWADGRKDYYINGKKLTEGEFMKRSKPEIDKGGTKHWKNAKGQYHREDGPAIEWANGEKSYYIKGQRHREDGPAVEYADGGKLYYIGGQLHREDGPAIEFANGNKYYYIWGQRHREDGPAAEYADGSRFYYIEGQLHREDGPAIKYTDGSKLYYIDGKSLTEDEFMKRSNPEIASDGTKHWKNAKGQYHREDGPAIEYADGGKLYYIGGQLHREDGPAIEYADGNRFYYIEGQLHREDGPAIEWSDGSKFYYINGKKLTEDEFMKRSRSKFVAGDEIRHRITKKTGKIEGYVNGTVKWRQNYLQSNSYRFSNENEIELLSIHKNKDGIKKLAEFSIEKEANLMRETVAMAHNYITSENLKRLEKLRHNLRSRTELNREELQAIRDGIKQPYKPTSKPVIKSEAYATNVAILFLMALIGLLAGILV